jgi:ATP-dependent Lon protease
MTLLAALSSIPVFPLSNVVLLPGAALPLHVFEPRYRTMLADCLATERALVVGVSAEDGAIAGAGTIVEHRSLPDGRSNILVVGEGRLRLDHVEPEDLPRYPYRRARATLLSDLPVDVDERDKAALVAAATMFTAEVKKHDPSFTFRIEGALSAGALADLCAFHLIIDGGARQAVLEDLDPSSRVLRVTSQLALQHGAIRREVGVMN